MKNEIQEIFNSYPEYVTFQMRHLRELIRNVAEEVNLGEVEETLKWRESSYLVKYGGAVRIDWKPKTPDQYYPFFHCQTKLVDTFRELYSGSLEFQGNQAIVLNVNEPLPEKVIMHCVELAFRYKRIKHLPQLGA